LSIFLQILFLLSVAAVVHSYLIYPIIIKYLAQQKAHNATRYTLEANMPAVFVIMAVYNEEKVLRKKLDSIFDTNYPAQKVWAIIGSDNSKDATNAILSEYAQRYKQLHWQNFAGRNGKINIINHLIDEHKPLINSYTNSVLVLTDANVFFTPDMFKHLCKHFKNERIALVGANVLNIGIKNTGISYQEQWYVQRENVIKHHEGKAFGAMMGAFGACYAIRANCFTPVPPRFIVDDFFQTLQCINLGYAAIKELEAICYEDVSDDIYEEFRRKKRISAGNFQNLYHFKRFLLPSTGISFAFWSHKVLRWLSPFFIVLAFVSSAYLAMVQQLMLYKLAFYMQLALFSIPIIDRILKRLLGKHIKAFRFITYFYLMNIALFIGFITYLKGINTNVWKPTKRN